MEHELEFSRSGKQWGWVLAFGFALIVLGVMAFSWPIGSTIGLTFYLGALFMIVGCIVGVHSIMHRHESGSGWRALHAVVAIIAGVLMYRYPGAGMMSVAIMLSFYFLMTAATKGMVAFEMRSTRGAGWLFLSAATSLLLGLYILATFPVSALWIPGFILGIDLVMYGTALIVASLDLKHLSKPLEGPVMRHA